MLRLLARRASVQVPLLAAVLAVVTVGATLLGVCALLLTTSQQRALERGMARTKAENVDLTAYASGVKGPDAQGVTRDTREVLAKVLAPLGSSDSTRASSAMRRLGPPVTGPRHLAYFSGVDDLTAKARLSSGRWPRPSTTPGRFEAVILEPTARVLGLHPGSTVELGPEVPPTPGNTPEKVTVVGVLRPLPDAGWDRDPLGAAGYDPAYLDGRSPQSARAYGPFVIAMGDLFASGSSLDRLQVTSHPNLTAPTDAELGAVAASMSTVNARMRTVLGSRVQIERVASDLPLTLYQAHAQQTVTRSTVLVVILLGTTLTAAALGLAGRLVASLRITETALFSALGASRGQLLALAAAEAGALAVGAAVLAVPLSGLAHSGLTHLPMLVHAGLATGLEVTGPQVAAVVIGAVVLAGVLVIPSLRPDPAVVLASRSRREFLARSGADLVLVGLAVAGWWQLRSQPPTPTGSDAVRVLAPVLCLLAGAGLARRLVAIPLRLGEGLARRSRRLVLPLAAFEAARQPRAVAAALLLALAAAAGTFGLAFGSTWSTSQNDQADARVGTDLALSLTSPAVAGQGATVHRATGGLITPAVDRTVQVGQWFGDSDNPPRLIAVDATRAGSLLRGRLPTGTSWAGVGARLAPAGPVSGLALRPGADPGLTLRGSSTSGPQLRALPRLVLQDATGVRSSCEATQVVLDGEPHPIQVCGQVGPDVKIVAVSLSLDVDPAGPPSESAGTTQATVDLRVPIPAGASAPTVPGWAATTGGDGQDRVSDPASTVTSTGAASTVRTVATVNVADIYYDPAVIVATAFATPAAVPVAVSSQLVQALNTTVGQRLTVSLGNASFLLVVASVVPDVPSAPDTVAMLADVDVLSRMLIARGSLEGPVNAWWVGGPDGAGARERADALGLGEVATRAEVGDQLRTGPLRIGLPAALAVLVPAAVLLVLAGTIMHVTSDVETRAVEVARLRGLGLPRRSVLGSLLAQHGGVLVLLLAAGGLVGAVVSWSVGPLLIRSDLGAAPVPGAVAHWPWPAEAGLLALLLAGGLSVVFVVVAVQVRRADAAHLRVGP